MTPIEKLAHAAQQAAIWTQHRDAAILSSRAAGATWKAIATAAKLSEYGAMKAHARIILAKP